MWGQWTHPVAGEHHAAALEVEAILGRLGAVDDQVVLPAPVLLLPGLGLRSLDALVGPNDGAEADEE